MKMDSDSLLSNFENFIYLFVTRTFVVIFGCFLVKELTMGICSCNKKLYGSVAIVTGANSGIGFETSLGLVKRGAKVYLCCKTLELAKDAMKRIKLSGRYDPDCVVVSDLDLSSLPSVRNFAKTFLEQESHLDILVNNAGIPSGCFANQSSDDLVLTEDNLEVVMQTNYFGHFLLTNLLRNHLRKSRDPRVINLSSIYNITGVIDLTNLNGEKYYNSQQAYPISKLAMLMFSTEIASRWNDDNIKSYSVHPGFVRTNLFQNTSRLYHHIHPFFGLIFGKSCVQGAQTSLHCCLCDNLKNGAFFMDCREDKLFFNKAAKDDLLVSRLWEESEFLVKMKST